MIRISSVSLRVIIAALLLIAQFDASAAAGPTELVTRIPQNFQAPPGGNGDSVAPVISRNGRFVVFSSSANDLVTNDNSHFGMDVFLLDRASNIVVLASVNSTGKGGGYGNSMGFGVSTNGRYVVFQSDASDLVPNDINDRSDIFLRDLNAGVTYLVSISTTGSAANGSSTDPVISADGRYVAFRSTATNLVPADANGIPDIFVRDLLTQATSLVSVGAVGSSASAGAPAMTPDGQKIAFASSATGMVPGVNQGRSEVYLRDRSNNSTYLASTNAASLASPVLDANNLPAWSPVLSDDGRFIAFKVGSSNALKATIIMRHDRTTRSTVMVHTNSFPGWWHNDNVYGPEMTPDGRFIAFAAREPYTNCSVRLWDAQTGITSLVSGNGAAEVPVGSFSHSPSLSADGSRIAFLSNAHLVPGSVISNGFHLYVRNVAQNNTVLLDRDPQGVASTDQKFSRPQILLSGEHVFWSGFDGKVVSGDTNGAADIFMANVTSGTIELLSRRHPAMARVSSQGLGPSLGSSISADGRWIAFSSFATELVPNDTNNTADIFLRDRESGTTRLVTTTPAGGAASGGYSSEPRISRDGRFVAFLSDSPHLAPSISTRGFTQVYLHDALFGTNQLVSFNGTVAVNGHCASPLISDDGRYVAFTTVATAFGLAQVCRWDRTSRTLLPIPGSSYGTNGIAMSADGRLIAYQSSGSVRVYDAQVASNILTTPGVLGAGSLNSAGNRLLVQQGGYIRARSVSGGSNLVSFVSSARLPGSPQWSADGRFFVFSTTANLVPNDSNSQTDVYLYDLLTGTLTLVSARTNGLAAGRSESQTISGDGRFVVYRSSAGNLVPHQPSRGTHVVVFDRFKGSNTLGSPEEDSGDGMLRSFAPLVSDDGRIMTFHSWANTIVQGDLNRIRDFYATSLAAAMDLDFDRIPDEWTLLHFGHGTGQPEDFSRADDDADGDGMLNREEYVAGTNPTVSTSLLRIRTPFVSNTSVLRWSSAPGRVYTVQRRATLNSGDWIDLAVVPATGVETEFAISPQGGEVFYRIVASL